MKPRPLLPARSNGKHPVGRPTKYHPDYCQQIIVYMQRGGKRFTKPMVVSLGKDQGSEIVDHPIGRLPAYFEGFAKKINVTVETLLEWCRVHPEFSEAYKKAKQIQLQKLLDGLLAQQYNPAGAIFILKNGHGYKDRDDSQDPKQLVNFIVQQITVLLPNPQDRLAFVEKWEQQLPHAAASAPESST